MTDQISAHRDDTADARALREAVAVLRARSSKPRGFWLRALCQALLSAAGRIEAGS
jgi:hypothetical protein